MFLFVFPRKRFFFFFFGQRWGDIWGNGGRGGDWTQHVWVFWRSLSGRKNSGPEAQTCNRDCPTLTSKAETLTKKIVGVIWLVWIGFEWKINLNRSNLIVLVWFLNFLFQQIWAKPIRSISGWFGLGHRIKLKNKELQFLKSFCSYNN